MREIKFRAWDKENNCWATNDNALGWLHYANGEYEPTNLTGNYILLQYTGLKDKAGREIYEGDILKRTSQWGKVLPDKTEVKWKAGYNYNGWNIARTSNAEVIGNIYQNPELLK